MSDFNDRLLSKKQKFGNKLNVNSKPQILTHSIIQKESNKILMLKENEKNLISSFQK